MAQPFRKGHYANSRATARRIGQKQRRKEKQFLQGLLVGQIPKDTSKKLRVRDKDISQYSITAYDTEKKKSPSILAVALGTVRKLPEPKERRNTRHCEIREITDDVDFDELIDDLERFPEISHTSDSTLLERFLSGRYHKPEPEPDLLERTLNDMWSQTDSRKVV